MSLLQSGMLFISITTLKFDQLYKPGLQGYHCINVNITINKAIILNLYILLCHIKHKLCFVKKVYIVLNNNIKVIQNITIVWQNILLKRCGIKKCFFCLKTVMEFYDISYITDIIIIIISFVANFVCSIPFTFNGRQKQIYKNKMLMPFYCAAGSLPVLYKDPSERTPGNHNTFFGQVF